MQTFLPYPDYKLSAMALDMRRLGKQRVEVLQILKALNGESKGWVNHPATLMWKGYEHSLVDYGKAICNEWVQRGYQDTCADKIEAYRAMFPNSSTDVPFWMGDKAFHTSHKSNLRRKDPDYYAVWFDIPKDMEYVWPNGKGWLRPLQ
jgi:hypothetical protein|tara:strand:+ start:33310 stop:33753 length:444 start_codon:yes stop_codon:yes gene_type:complete